MHRREAIQASPRSEKGAQSGARRRAPELLDHESRHLQVGREPEVPGDVPADLGQDGPPRRSRFLIYQVLQFNGFFKESVVESRLETARLRKLIIYFYLEDDSIAMVSPKQENSEIPQGQFLSRQKVGALSLFDFVDFEAGRLGKVGRHLRYGGRAGSLCLREEDQADFL